MQVISITNQKGGTGKTTSVLNIGAGLAKKKKKILLLDIEPQADLTTSLGIEEEDIEYTSDDIINNRADIRDTIIKLNNGINIIPGSNKLTGTQINLTKVDIVKEALRDIKDEYDYILIDTQPSLGILTVNAIITSHVIIVAFQPEYLALTGIKSLTDIVDMLKDKYDIEPIIKILITMYDQRKKLHQEAIQSVKKHFKKDVFKTKIRTNVALAESVSHGKDIFDYNPKSHGAIDYITLCNEIIRL